ncbi:hypothetical protein AMATHDRAFT_1887 [Amanita thiersii Skay4041]|uniref:Importin N-terminal domain-containing protein n=1 Tax=Amanita thiersii Skay4041 TaxID=703135 RepID=A0A2A9NPD2_9AGAR|nr:hypothetical protein AMATHDRAFT_1887 [Amanita thiersii Skay4041]
MSTARPNIAGGVTIETVSQEELFQVISNASSQNPIFVQQSSKRLKQMLDMFGTFNALSEIAAQRNLALHIRQQAIIQFKNAALGHWKSRKLLSDEHRANIRTRTLSFLDEIDDTIFECNEVIVSKIARQDYPSKWPNLINDLMSVIDTTLQKYYSSIGENNQALLLLRRSLQLLNSILKEFGSIKMPTGVKVMAEIVDQLHLILYSYYSKIAASVSPSNVNLQNLDSPYVYGNFLLAHLIFKCLVKIAVWLWQKVDRLPKEESAKQVSWLQELFANSTFQLQTLFGLRQTLLNHMHEGGLGAIGFSRSIDILTRHIRLFGKLFRRLQQLSHVRFTELPMCGDLILFYWNQVVNATSGSPDFIADSNNAIYPVRFLVQGMVLFKDSLGQWSESRSARMHGTPNKNTLSKEFVETAVKVLITSFMPLNPSDLDNWVNDPEEWVNIEDKENDQWEYEIRPCSERVLVQLSNQFEEVVTPLLVSTFNEIATQLPVNLSSVLQKEALYCALGRCAQHLRNTIPFDQWLHETLSLEAQSRDPNSPIIKRRIAWLLGKWMSDSCASVKDPKVWEILAHLLKDRGAGTDTVVRLTAATALRECIDTIDFDADVFAPFLPSIISELVMLMSEADTMESKRRIDHSLNTVIEQSGVVPFIDMITKPLPQLWNGAGDDWLLKGSLLTTVTKLVESVKAESSSLGGIVVPLIRESLSPGAISYLDDDGLTLWLSALRNTVTISNVNGAPALNELFPLALELLATNLDLLGKITSIIESYIILDALGILQAHGVHLFRAFLSAIKSDAVTINIRDMIISLNLLVQTSPAALWGGPMYNSGLFSYMITTLAEGEKGTMLLTEYIYLFARIITADRQIFLQLMAATATATNLTEKYLFEALLDQWWGKASLCMFDSMSEPRCRKLAAMGIASLVSTARPEVLERLPTEIFNLWLDVFGEIKELQVISGADDSTPSPSPTNFKRYWELSDAPLHYFQSTEGTPEYDRRKAIYDRDPVRNIRLNAFIATHLQEAEAICGPTTFQSIYLSRADSTVLRQIQDEFTKL